MMRQSNVLNGNNVRPSSPFNVRDDVTDANDDVAARTRALGTGWLVPLDLEQEELITLLEGVDTVLLHELCQQLDALVVAAGRAIVMLSHLNAVIERVEAEKATEVRPHLMSVITL